MTRMLPTISKYSYLVGKTYWHEAQCKEPEIAKNILELLKKSESFARLEIGRDSLPLTPLMCWGGREFSDMGDGVTYLHQACAML